MAFKREELVKRFTYLKTAALPGDNVYIVDGLKMKDGKSIVTEIYRALGLTEYIPYANYNGLDELLSHDVWPEKHALYLAIENVDALLESNSEVDIVTLFEIFGDKVQAWRAALPSGLFEVYLL